MTDISTQDQAEAVQLTRAQRIEKKIADNAERISKAEALADRLIAENKKLRAALENAAVLEEFENTVNSEAIVGRTVDFYFGRAANRKLETGTVIAFKPKEDKVAAAVRVSFGSGFDATLVTVPTAAIKRVDGIDYVDADEAEATTEGEAA
jgi:hypothetical protein